MRIVLLGGVVLILIAISSLPMSVQAQTPTPVPTVGPTFTPTATLRPLQPTPTSKYQHLRYTPTPWNVQLDATMVANFDTKETSKTLADTIINGYRALNMNAVMDWIAFVVVGVVVIMFLLRIQKRMTDLS